MEAAELLALARRARAGDGPALPEAATYLRCPVPLDMNATVVRVIPTVDKVVTAVRDHTAY
jgi:hypothetical protein